jgi:flagellar biosynthesis/type III secretory pathway protein FliH
VDVFKELERIVSRLEEKYENARDEGFKQGGEAEGRRAVDRLVKALIDDVDRRRRQAELPLPLHPGVMSLDQVEKMIRKVASR